MKLYIVVRSDMSKAQQAVQAGHAVAEILIRKRISWKNGTLIYLSQSSEKKLRKLFEKVPTKNKIAFHEPFWDNSMTAFAAYGREVSEFLRKLPLL
jgi:peptidyl-tRNA hydrolase